MADGDCGYNAFGVTREMAHHLIAINFREVCHLLRHLMEEVLITDHFFNYLQKNGHVSPALEKAYSN